MSEPIDTIETARNVATVASAGAAWAALGLSIFTYWIQRKSLRFTEEKEGRQRSTLEIYTRSLSSQYDEARTRYTTKITVTNAAEVGNAVRRASLLITYQMSGGASSTISISGTVIDRDGKENEFEAVNLSSRSTQNIDLIFDVKAGVLHKSIPRRTVLEIEDTEGRTSSLEVVFQ